MVGPMVSRGVRYLRFRVQGAGGSWSRSGFMHETAFKFVRCRDFELIVAAVFGAPVRAPAEKRRCVPKRSPCMWSYFTSHTRSIRSGSHDRSLPALQRLWPPGIRCPLPSASAHSRHGCFVSAFFRSGSSSLTSALRAAIVKDEVTPMWCRAPLSS